MVAAVAPHRAQTGLRLRHCSAWPDRRRPPLPDLQRAALRPRRLHPRLLRVRLPGRRACSSAACSACSPPMGCSTAGRPRPPGPSPWPRWSLPPSCLDPVLGPAVRRRSGGLVATGRLRWRQRHPRVLRRQPRRHRVACGRARPPGIPRRAVLCPLPGPLSCLSGAHTRTGGTHWSFWPTELLRLVIVFAIACFSWFLIEKPLMRWRQRVSRPADLPHRVRHRQPLAQPGLSAGSVE